MSSPNLDLPSTMFSIESAFARKKKPSPFGHALISSSEDSFTCSIFLKNNTQINYSPTLLAEYEPVAPPEPPQSLDWSLPPSMLMTEEISLDGLKPPIVGRPKWRMTEPDRLEKETGEAARVHPLYHDAKVKADGLYHCLWEEEGCQHKPEKLKCNYDKFIDSHIKPYRCKVITCNNLSFSSTACLLRHEREAHALHGLGAKPFLCTYEGCDRGVTGNGFPRYWNLRDHLKRTYNDNGRSDDERRGMEKSIPVLRGKKRKSEEWDDELYVPGLKSRTMAFGLKEETKSSVKKEETSSAAISYTSKDVVLAFLHKSDVRQLRNQGFTLLDRTAPGRHFDCFAQVVQAVGDLALEKSHEELNTHYKNQEPEPKPGPEPQGHSRNLTQYSAFAKLRQNVLEGAHEIKCEIYDSAFPCYCVGGMDEESRDGEGVLKVDEDFLSHSRKGPDILASVSACNALGGGWGNHGHEGSSSTSVKSDIHSSGSVFNPGISPAVKRELEDFGQKVDHHDRGAIPMVKVEIKGEVKMEEDPLWV